MQLTYALRQSEALPGMLADTGAAFVVSYQAAEDLPCGRVVVLNEAGELELPKAATLAKVVGVALYVALQAPGGWKAGDLVPVLRSGRVWCEFEGGTVADLAPARVHHASTDEEDMADHRGKLTASATSVAAGEEVSTFARALFRRASAEGLALVELNGPLQVQVDEGDALAGLDEAHPLDLRDARADGLPCGHAPRRLVLAVHDAKRVEGRGAGQARERHPHEAPPHDRHDVARFVDRPSRRAVGDARDAGHPGQGARGVHELARLVEDDEPSRVHRPAREERLDVMGREVVLARRAGERAGEVEHEARLGLVTSTSNPATSLG